MAHFREDVEPAARLNVGAVVVGALIASLLFATLVSLGLAVGGESLKSLLSNANRSPATHAANGLDIGAMVWLGLATWIAVSLGSYLAARASRPHTRTIGAVQGLATAALFFGIIEGGYMPLVRPFGIAATEPMAGIILGLLLIGAASGLWGGSARMPRQAGQTSRFVINSGGATPPQGTTDFSEDLHGPRVETRRKVHLRSS